MCTHRLHKFEPLAPGARIYNDQQDRPRNRGHRHDITPPLHACSPPIGRPGPQVPLPCAPRPDRLRAGCPNKHLCADKVVNMLRSSFIDESTAAGRMGHTILVHKLGIKTRLPKCYEGEPDPTVFKNWLSLLLGFFRIHQLCNKTNPIFELYAFFRSFCISYHLSLCYHVMVRLMSGSSYSHHTPTHMTKSSFT